MLSWLVGLLCAVAVFGTDLTLEPGHLKPFGEGGFSQPVEELDYFPSARDFFENYVKPLKPVKMKGAAKMSAAFGKWNDDYFLTLDESSKHQVSVETKKKENRQQPQENMQFKEFVKSYNDSEYYMVDSVPTFLRSDILLPCPLQCMNIVNDDLVENVMWYSSGGTKSVVHTDGVDNINCLYRGEKSLVFVDPDRHGDKVDLDRLDGSYSSMDVDSVDYTKFPGMADVEFYHVRVMAGDCLYIPYFWIHQVRSYGSNIAVNVWWKHDLSVNLDYSKCSDPCNPEMTLESGKFHGFDDLLTNPDDIKNDFMSFFGNQDQMDLRKLLKGMLGSLSSMLMKEPEIRHGVYSIFELLDANEDRLITMDEIEEASNQVWYQVGKDLIAINSKVENFAWEQENADDKESDNDFNDSVRDEL